MRFHLDMRVAELRALGMNQAEAEAEALRRMGDLEALRAELVRTGARQRRVGQVLEWLSNWALNVRLSTRRLLSSPLFTTGATLTMAIAIGATASVFGVVDGVLLKPFPVRDPSRVLYLQENLPPPLGELTVSLADYRDWRTQNHVFSSLAAMNQILVTVKDAGGSERVIRDAVTPNYFSALGMMPRLGRFLSADSTSAAEVVITYEYWQREFGGAASVLGRSLTLDGKLYTVVGVADKGWPGTEQLWIRLNPADEPNRGYRDLNVYGRLKPDITLETARHDLQTIAERLAQAYPETNKSVSVVIVPVLDTMFGDVRPALVMLLAAAACVLLIGSANLANLFLVRCLAREREMAVRTALGATRRRLARELLVEAVILSLVAGALGVGVALIGVNVLHALAPTDLPRLPQVGVDGRLVAFCALATTATVIVFGLVPAWQASRGSLADMLKEGGRGTRSAQHRRLQDGLTVLQIVVAFVLLTGASLLVESFERYHRMDPGFRPEGVLAAQVALPIGPGDSDNRSSGYMARAVELLAALPGVQRASASSGVPGIEGDMATFRIVGDPRPGPNPRSIAVAVVVSPEYFRTMGYRLRRGRGVLASDDSRSTKVVVIDEMLARWFGGRDPLGRLITLPRHDTVQIVGIVAPVKEEGLLAAVQPHIYVPFAQLPQRVFYVEVRTAADPERQSARLRHVIATIDPAVAVSDVETMTSRMGGEIATMRFSAFLASLFASLALVLGAFGIYSVLAYIVGQRKREIGVRIALGAKSRHVMSDVLRRALTLTSLGIALGAGATWVVTRALASLFVGVRPHDPFIVAGVAGSFVLVALVAASVPAYRTTRVNPVVALSSS